MMIDRSSHLPYYLQIKEYLNQCIENGVFPVGSKIPSETELTKLFNVSRITVRQAIESLTQSGLVEKRQGKGTYVRRPKVTQELNLITSWAETMRERGFAPETLDFSCEEMAADETLSATLQIAPGEPVYHIERLRQTENEPVCIMKNYIPVRVAPGLIEREQIRNSIYPVLEEEYHVQLATAVETIEARSATAREAAMLMVRRGAPVLNVQRVTCDPGGQPVELVVVVSRADKYAYRLHLSGRPPKR